jgi:uncharacterized membrane protein HdeD (DUF308 family)
MDDVLARTQARVTKDVDDQLSGARWALAIRGLFAIAFGAAILIWPGISLLSLTLVFGAFSLFYGVVTLASVFSAATWQSRLWLLLVAAVDIAAGIAVIAWPNISALALLYAILFGIVMFSRPGDGALVLLALIAAFSFVSGVMMFAFAIGLGNPERVLTQAAGKSSRQTARAHA